MPRVSLYGAALLIAMLLFGVANYQVTALKRERIDTEMRLALPPAVQLITTGGDRHLAANIGTFRAVTVGVFQLKPETYDVLADVQLSAARLNPYHEDNYYTAAAILAWNEELETAQQILSLAADARTEDALPLFFHGFNRYYFYGDFNGASQDLRRAADRIDGPNRIALQAIAQKWFERGQSPSVAVDLMRKLAAQSQNQQFKALLGRRILRLEGLIVLQAAAVRFAEKEGRQLRTIEELVSSRMLGALPQDPMGLGYTLDSTGKPMLAAPVRN